MRHLNLKVMGDDKSSEFCFFTYAHRNTGNEAVGRKWVWSSAEEKNICIEIQKIGVLVWKFHVGHLEFCELDFAT